MPDAADDYCEYSDFPFETMLGIIASELSEKDAKTFNDVASFSNEIANKSLPSTAFPPKRSVKGHAVSK